MDKEGGFVNRPPMLTGSNYDHWKPKMIAFLKSIDSRTWKAVLKGWDCKTQDSTVQFYYGTLVSATSFRVLVRRLCEYRHINEIFAETEPVLCSCAGKAQTFGS
ncbi:gag-protease polyprotein [Trifolium repens]|nr:gag-protease polyprotein [Trifolium repens]